MSKTAQILPGSEYIDGARMDGVGGKETSSFCYLRTVMSVHQSHLGTLSKDADAACLYFLC